MGRLTLFFDIAAAFSVALLSGMGVGGGGLFVVYLTLIRHLGQLSAQGINLWFFIAAAASSLVIALIKKQLDFKMILSVTLPGAFFAYIGSMCAANVDTAILKTVFGIFMLGAGVFKIASLKRASLRDRVTSKDEAL